MVNICGIRIFERKQEENLRRRRSRDSQLGRVRSEKKVRACGIMKARNIFVLWKANGRRSMTARKL